MSRRLFIHSPFANITREIVTDAVTGDVRVLVHEDLDAVFKSNQRQRLDNPQGYVCGDKDLRKIATIPLTLCLIIERETGINLTGSGLGRDLTDDEWRIINARYLRNPDYSKVRTSDMVM